MSPSGPIPKSDYAELGWIGHARKYPSQGILFPQGRILPWLKKLAVLCGISVWLDPNARRRDRGHRRGATLERSYWRMVHDRAVLEAAAALHLDSRQQLLIKALVIPVGLVVLVWFGSPAAAKDELILTVFIAWAIALCLLPLVYLWKLWGLPPRVHQEQLIAHQSKTAALEARFEKKQEHIKFYKQIRDLQNKGQNLLDRSAPADNLVSWSAEVEECLRNAREFSELELFRTILSSGGVSLTHSMKLAKLRLILGRATGKVVNA
jgi:hypothetical protein